MNKIATLLLVLTAAFGFTACGSDDDDVPALTREEATTCLDRLWGFTLDGTEYALSLARHNSALVSTENGVAAVLSLADNYVVQPASEDDFSAGVIIMGGSLPTTLQYRHLTAESVQVSLNGQQWATARLVAAADGALTMAGAEALLLSGKWTSTACILPLPDEAEDIADESAFSTGYTPGSGLWISYGEERDYTLSGEQRNASHIWLMQHGVLATDPDHTQTAWADCLIRFGENGAQVMQVSGLDETGCMLTGFSYGSNFLGVRFTRTVQ